jgi:hypothetical protein
MATHMFSGSIRAIFQVMHVVVCCAIVTILLFPRTDLIESRAPISVLE